MTAGRFLSLPFHARCYRRCVCLQAEVRAGGRRFQEMAGLTAAKQSAVEEQAAHMTATMQRLQSAIATKDTLIAELQVMVGCSKPNTHICKLTPGTATR